MHKRTMRWVGLKKLWSWLYPVVEYATPGKLPHQLEVTWENGKCVLNTATANYSFGSLHTVFKKTLQPFPLPQNFQGPVLILGFGAGSIYQLLRKQYPSVHIVGVDADPEVWRLANQYFLPQQDKNLDQVTAFAEDFCDKPTGPYQAVFVDVFVNTETPAFFEHPKFWVNIKNVLTTGGNLYVNLMPNKNQPNEAIARFKEIFDSAKSFRPTQENLVLVAYK